MRLRSRSRCVRSFVRLAAVAASSSSRARSDRSSSPRRSSSLSLTRCARSVSTRAARASARATRVRDASSSAVRALSADSRALRAALVASSSTRVRRSRRLASSPGSAAIAAALRSRSAPIAVRLDARPDLAKDVVDPHELDLGGLEPVERFLPAQLQASRPGRLLDDGAPIRRTQREYLVDQTLADDDERVVGQVGAREEILKIAQANARTVHKVFGFAVAEETPADLDLGEVDGKSSRRVVELQQRFGVTQRFSRFASAEDQLLVLLRAQYARVVLTEGPAHRIGHVTFPAAVSANDCGDPWTEFQMGWMT